MCTASPPGACLQWQQHKSWRRHAPNWLVCLRVVAWYWPPLFFFALVGALVGVYNKVLQSRGW